ncbi:transposase [Nostoc sp. ChiVER01]|nr:transposase [Nostoc sp. ChiVER01]MDZ8224982.1 transposase [Nostoc sp. ChiVER01]
MGETPKTALPSLCGSFKEWAIIEPLLPQKKQTRPPKWTKRQILDGIFYQLKNGNLPIRRITRSNLAIHL